MERLTRSLWLLIKYIFTVILLLWDLLKWSLVLICLIKLSGVFHKKWEDSGYKTGVYTKRGIFPDRWDAEQLWESEGRLASVDRMIPVVPSLSFSSIHQMQIPTFQSPAETRPWHFTHASISDLFTSNYTLQLLMGINVLCIFQSLAQLLFCATHCAKWSKTVVYENPSKFLTCRYWTVEVSYPIY